MTEDWRHLPAPARPIAAPADAAVTAARAADQGALTAAVDDLAALDPATTGLILGTAVRLLLERTHPDGLDSDDVRTVLTHCVRAFPQADPQVLLVLLASALGALDEELPPPKPDELALHASLLFADLLGAGSVRELLTAALGEIERAQLND